MNYIAIFDVLKFILAIEIVIIHSKLFPNITYPWTRLAVPLFFMISAFLFFSKLNLNPNDKKQVVKKYVFRNLKLYCFWFIVLLPVTIINRAHWFDNGLGIGIYTSLKNLLFSSTFAASWFITASIWAILILSFLASKVSNKFIFIFASIIYVFCCIESSYLVFFNHFDLFIFIRNLYLLILPSPVFSFPVALFWMTLGKLFADNVIHIKKKTCIIGAIISAIFLFIEWKVISSTNDIYSKDCYFFLAPLAFFIFAIVKDIKINLKNSVLLRKCSTMLFCMHDSIIIILGLIIQKILKLNLNSNTESIFVFILTLLISFIIISSILKLENKKEFLFLKNSH